MREINEHDFDFLLGMARKRGEASCVYTSGDNLKTVWDVGNVHLSSTLNPATGTWTFHAEPTR